MENVNAQTRTNSLSFRSMLEKHTLTGPNFNEWFRALKLVVCTEKIQDVFETTLPSRPVGVGDAPDCISSLNTTPLEMYNELYQMYGKPPGVELQEFIHLFHTCKQGDGASTSDHFLLMKSYLDQLASLNYTFDDKIAIGFILESLTSDFHGYVQNYNMQSMGKTLFEVHQMLIEYEKGIKKNKQQTVGASSFTPQVMAIQGGRVQKKPHGKAKGKGNAKGGQYSYPSKTKNPQPQKKECPTKEGQCHHCKEVGHWKRNCLIYLAELKKKKSGQMVASTSLELQVKCYYDAGFETDRDDTKSQTGYVFTLNGGAVVWKSSKQSTTAQHAAKAEYIAASEAAKEVVWIRKHFQRKFHYVRECAETGEIEMVKVHTDDNLADPFTKALAGHKVTRHARSMGLRPASSFM
nr:hypothetical protein [Tanacetum cinerariifolium]